MVAIGCLFPLFVLAQNSGGNSPVVFKVRNPQMELSVPGDSILWMGKANQIKIRISGAHKIGAVVLDNGRISGSDSSYVAYVNKGGSALLSIYERKSDSTLKLCFTKLYTIKKIPDPVVLVCGIGNDSVANKLDLVYKNKITALWKDYKMDLPVVSFKMISFRNDLADTLVSHSDEFTIEMRNRIHQMQEGSMLYIVDAVCVMPDGDKKKLAPVEVYIAETNKYNVGFRKFGQ